MASRTNALSASLIYGFDPDLFIGLYFLPTPEDGIRIVKRKNADRELFPIFEVHDYLFQLPPEQVGEGYYFTTLKLVGKKVNRTLGDPSGSGRFWKNSDKAQEVVVDNEVIGWVTKLVLHKDKNTPTEWHSLEYRDTKTPDPRRWVLCQIYKREKNNGSRRSRGDVNQVQHYEMGESSNYLNADLDMDEDEVNEMISELWSEF